MTSNCLQSFSSASAEQRKGSFSLSMNLSVDFTLSRGTPTISTPGFAECTVEIPKILASRGCSGGHVLR